MFYKYDTLKKNMFIFMETALSIAHPLCSTWTRRIQGTFPPLLNRCLFFFSVVFLHRLRRIGVPVTPKSSTQASALIIPEPPSLGMPGFSKTDILLKIRITMLPQFQTRQQ